MSLVEHAIASAAIKISRIAGKKCDFIGNNSPLKEENRKEAIYTIKSK